MSTTSTNEMTFPVTILLGTWKLFTEYMMHLQMECVNDEWLNEEKLQPLPVIVKGEGYYEYREGDCYIRKFKDKLIISGWKPNEILETLLFIQTNVSKRKKIYIEDIQSQFGTVSNFDLIN
jgi:hypothetical protein